MASELPATLPQPSDGPWTRAGLQKRGFAGWSTFPKLPAAPVPSGSGVYVVVRPSLTPVAFLAASPAGSHKGKSPTVAPARLSAKWVPDTAVVYIGKATSLKDRLDDFRRQGTGNKAGHWGGRYIWQLSDWPTLIVGWMTTDKDPEDAESELLSEFVATYGRLPFANLKLGRRIEGKSRSL